MKVLFATTNPAKVGKYKKALEESLKEKVKHVYIYSIYLNKEIEITF